MSRPEFPRCILPVKAIRAIVAEQKTYDDDPEEYERWKRILEEQRQQERQREQEREQLEYEYEKERARNMEEE